MLLVSFHAAFLLHICKAFILSVLCLVSLHSGYFLRGVCAINSLFRLLLHSLAFYYCYMYVVGHRTASQQWAVEGLSMYHQWPHDPAGIFSSHICRSYRPTE